MCLRIKCQNENFSWQRSWPDKWRLLKKSDVNSKSKKCKIIEVKNLIGGFGSKQTQSKEELAKGKLG